MLIFIFIFEKRRKKHFYQQTKIDKTMAQAQIRPCELGSEVDISVTQKKKKITFNIDTSHYISIFNNETGGTVINIRKGTRSVSIT